jgi:hypothetical protein
MSTPAAALKPVSQHNILLVTEDRRAAFESLLRQTIQDRAFQIFERHGGVHGQDQANWAQAEAELLQFAPPARESGAWSTANVSLRSVDPRNVQVLVLEDHAVVAIANPAQPPAYLLIRWPIHVDPATAAAYLKDTTLVVTAKHSASMGGS